MSPTRVCSLFAMMALLLFSSCRGSGTLTSNVNTPTGSIAGTPGATATRVNGSASGGLSPIKGGTVTLYQAGNPSALATAATDSNGAFQLSLPSLNSNGLYYIVVTSGNAGSGNNANIQEMAILGTGATIPSTAGVNELTTAASLLVSNNLGLLQEGSGGAVTLTTPVSTAAASNGRLQYLNFINLTNGTLNTGNSNLTSTHQSVLATMANAFAACVENSSQCATLFSNSANSAGSAANVLDAGYKMLNGLSSISGINTQASSMSSSTGYTIPSAPSTLNVNVAATIQTFNVGGTLGGGIAIDSSGNAWAPVYRSGVAIISPSGSVTLVSLGNVGANASAIDASGNIWVVEQITNLVIKLSSNGSAITTIATDTEPNGIAIDASGNVWTSNYGNNTVTKITLSGVSSNFPTSNGSSHLPGIAIDASGNAWATDDSNSAVVKFSSSGSVLGTFTTGSSPRGLAIDASGNAWTANGGGNSISKLSSSGSTISTISSTNLCSAPRDVAFDASGNAWIPCFGQSTINALSPSGTWLGNFSVGSNPTGGIAIDASGNVWESNHSDSTVREIQNVAAGSQFFPYTGPVFGGSFAF